MHKGEKRAEGSSGYFHVGRNSIASCVTNFPIVLDFRKPRLEWRKTIIEQIRFLNLRISAFY